MSFALPPSLNPSSLSAKDRARLYKAGFASVIVLGHVGVVLMLSQAHPDAPDPAPLLINVELVRPDLPLPPPPPPPPPPAPESGGGRAAAPSRIHVTPTPPPEVPRELPAPIVQAAEPDPVVVGVSDTRSPAPAFGQGGEGNGTGTGRGDGAGPGTGLRTGPQNLRRPTLAEIRRYHPSEALRARVDGSVTVRCWIGEDQRLQRCSVTRESPQGYGFGQAALRLAIDTYRFRPATRDGYYDGSVPVYVEIDFGRPGAPRG